MPAGTGNGVAWSPDGRYVAVAHATTPFVTVYEQDGTTFTKLGNPSTLPPNEGRAVEWSPTGSHLVVGHMATPFITIYSHDGNGGFTKLTNPSLPVNYVNRVAFSPDGTHMVVGHFGTPFATFYSVSGDTFTKLSNPSSLPPSEITDVRWSPDSRYVSMGTTASPYVVTYERSGSTFTKIADLPGTLPVSAATAVAWNAEGTVFSYGFGVTPFIHIYSFDSTTNTFTKLSNPSPLPESGVRAIAWNPNGAAVAVTYGTSPRVKVYDDLGTTFTGQTWSATSPTGTGNAIGWNPTSEYLAVAHSTTPFVSFYATGYEMPPAVLAPENFSVTPSPPTRTHVDARWDAVDGADQYRLERDDGDFTASTVLTGTFHRDTGVSCGIEYQYRVRVEAPESGAYTEWLNVTPCTGPAVEPQPIFGVNGSIYGGRTNPDGSQSGGRDALAELLSITPSALDVWLGLILVGALTMTGFAVVPSFRVIGSAAGAVGGIVLALIFGFFPVWLVAFVGVVLVAAFVLLQARSGE